MRSSNINKNEKIQDTDDTVTEEYFLDESKPKLFLGSLRQETELFKEDDYIPQDLITVKRISLPKRGENWQILKNKQVVMLIKGIRFTAKEREFFRSLEGMRFLISGYKEGWTSISEFKRQVKKINSPKNKKRK